MKPVDDGPGDRVVAAEEGIELAREIEHGFFRQRAALADDLEALRLEEGVVGAGGVLVMVVESKIRVVMGGPNG